MFAPMAERVLVVDDEPDLLELVRFHLAQAGFEVETARDGRQGLDAIRRRRPALVVLDWMLPDLSGSEVCRQVRADPQLRDLPILLLTAKSEEVDRVVGFELGADDYVTKPFSPKELVARVGALLRRASPRGEGGLLRYGPLVIDPDRHTVTLDGREMQLTAKEFLLLRYLVEHPAFIWLLGFPLVSSSKHACGFDPNASLPTQRHLTQMARDISNLVLQFLLDQSVALLLAEFAALGLQVGFKLLSNFQQPARPSLR